MEYLDPSDPKTHRNNPAPAIDESLVKDLADIGGLRSNGEPVLRFGWGQTRKEFRRGKERLLYVDTRIPAIETVRHCLKKVIRRETVKAYSHTKPGGEMVFNDKIVAHYDTIYLDGPPSLLQVIPPGYFYSQELVALEWVGEQLWYVEQYFPAEQIDDPDTWERNRYEDWFDPEIGEIVQRCDVLGEYPAAGRYQAIYVIGEPMDFTEPFEEKNEITEEWEPATRVRSHLRYRPPGGDTLEAMREARADRDRTAGMSKGERGRQRFERHRLKEQETFQKYNLDHRLRMKEDAWKFYSPDKGTLGVEGGGGRVYVDSVAGMSRQQRRHMERQAAKRQKRSAAA
jgi:hypothetical protein